MRCGDRGLKECGHECEKRYEAGASGEIFREELDTLGLSANGLSKALGVPVNRITMILNGQRGVTAGYFRTTPQLWLNLQKTWELRRAEIEAGREITERVTPRQAAA